MSDATSSRYWTRAEVCNRYSISASTLDAMQRDGKIAFVKIGASTRFPQSSIDAFDQLLTDGGLQKASK